VLIRLKEWRTRRGYSVRDLGQRAKVSFVSIVRIENGRMNPTVDLVERLARALDIHITDLFPPKPANMKGGAPHTRRRKEKR
jgi:transcriptional regulator with XRE-family HTH domain